MCLLHYFHRNHLMHTRASPPHAHWNEHVLWARTEFHFEYYMTANASQTCDVQRDMTRKTQFEDETDSKEHSKSQNDTACYWKLSKYNRACLNTERAKWRNVKIKQTQRHQKSCHYRKRFSGKHGVRSATTWSPWFATVMHCNLMHKLCWVPFANKSPPRTSKRHRMSHLNHHEL